VASSFRSTLRRVAAAVLALVLLSACAPAVQRVDWSDYDGPGAEAFRREELEAPRVPDPLEPFNRGVSAANHVLIIGIGDPLGRVYRFIVPRWVRARVQNFASNLVFPRRLVTNLLQGQFRTAGSEAARFGINTTAGVLGFFDPATGWGYEASGEDFGQVFASWGWMPSTYLVLPLFGPGSVRDGVALVPDALLDPATYFFPASLVLGFNEKVDWLDSYRAFVESNADPYADARLAWTLLRNTEALDFQWEKEDTAAVQTLQAVLLSPRDEGFATRLLTGSVIVPGTGRSLDFSYRLQPGGAPIVYVLPGLGSHRLGSSSVALAELAWERGFSVVVVSNALNFEFASRASSVPVPGHAPIDARDVHDVLDAIDRQLDAEFPGRITGRVLMGYSLGAFHTFFIAAAEPEPGNQRVRFDRYLTLDAPVSLMEGLRQLDGFYNAPLVYPAEQRDAEVHRILYKAVTVGKQLLAERERYSRSEVARSGADGSWLSGLEVPLTDLEARFLIGLAFRRTLRELIWTSQQRQDLGVLRTPRKSLVRNPAYEEIADYSYEEYLYAFVLPNLRDRGVASSADELLAANDLRSLEAALRANGRIRHFANSNDFLTTDDDEAWLVDVLGSEHVQFFPEGGHLGNLHRPEVQAQIMDAIADLLPVKAPAQ
jgi:ABC-type transporter lipoprotein component MlaA